MRLVSILLCLAAVASGQVIINPSSPTNAPGQLIVTTQWLYANKMRYAGAWSSTTTYSTQEVVTYTGSTYVSLQAANLNQIPSSSMSYWTPIGGGAGSSVRGGITGTLSNQTDLAAALAAKEPSITGTTTAQYWRGDKSFQTLSTAIYALLSGTSPVVFNSSTGAYSCPSCLTSSLITAVFGRTGNVTAQTGDYSFSQLSGSATVSQLPTTQIAQKFFGTAPPGSVSGNLPGDLFTDTTDHNQYVCNAPSGTAAPACTSVSTAGWLLLNTTGGSNPFTGPHNYTYTSGTLTADASTFTLMSITPSAGGVNPTVTITPPTSNLSTPIELKLCNFSSGTAAIWTFTNAIGIKAPQRAGECVPQNINYNSTTSQFEGQQSTATPSQIDMPSEKAAPTTPVSGVSIYPDSGVHNVHVKNSAGTVFGTFKSGADCNEDTGICTTTNGFAITQKFLGTAAPGSVAGNLPGDAFTDTTNHNVYFCNAPAGTPAPACTSVTTAGWELVNGGGSGTPGGTSGQIQSNNSGAFGGFTASGDATVNTGTGAVTLATVNANTGACGDATHVCQVTLDGKGRATAASPVAITGTGSPIISWVTPASDSLSCATINTTETPFATNYTIPANVLASGGGIRVSIGFDSTSAAALNQTLKLRIGGTGITGTLIFQGATTTISATNKNSGMQWDLTGNTAAGAAQNIITVTYPDGAGPYSTNTLVALSSATLATNGTLLLQPTWQCAGNTAGYSVSLTSFKVSQ